MKRLIVLLIIGMGFFIQPLYAEEKKSDTSSFWDRLRSKVESLTPQKKLGATTATGGVRGAAVATDDMYWKNDASAQTIASDEVEAFAKAVKLAEANDKAQAQAAFSEFVKKYPASSLRKEAYEAMVLLQNTIAPAK
ncbi:MAG: hypothetical protein OEV23_01335 [Gallionella sp.]|nr:hypothetical protein [Gallionella sp.]